MKSDKQHLLKSQEALIAEIFAGARNHLTHGDRFTFKVGINFTPNQHWIDKFAEIGFVFIPTPPSMQSGLTAFDIQYDRRLISDAAAKELEPELWEPVNGEMVDGLSYLSGKLRTGSYIGKDGEGHVINSDGAYIRVDEIKPVPALVEVSLSELLEAYSMQKMIDVHLLKVKSA